MENDLTKVEQLQNSCGDNCRVVARLFSGLRKFGHPNYQRDYGSDDGSDPLWTQLTSIASKIEGGKNRHAAASIYNELSQQESQYQNSKLAETYYHLLSEAAFQAAQYIIDDNRANASAGATALPYFEKSLAAAQEVCKCEEQRKNKYGLSRAVQGADFIRAHVAYLKNDLRQLQTLVGNCAGNKGIVDCLADGLMTYGGPNYFRDTGAIYHGEPKHLIKGKPLPPKKVRL